MLAGLAHRVSRLDRFGNHGGLDGEWCAMNRLVGAAGRLGDRQHVGRGQVRHAQVGQADGQAHGQAEVKDLVPQ